MFSIPNIMKKEFESASTSVPSYSKGTEFETAPRGIHSPSPLLSVDGNPIPFLGSSGTPSQLASAVSGMIPTESFSPDKNTLVLVFEREDMVPNVEDSAYLKNSIPQRGKPPPHMKIQGTRASVGFTLVGNLKLLEFPSYKLIPKGIQDITRERLDRFIEYVNQTIYDQLRDLNAALISLDDAREALVAGKEVFDLVDRGCCSHICFLCCGGLSNLQSASTNCAKDIGGKLPTLELVQNRFYSTLEAAVAYAADLVQLESLSIRAYARKYVSGTNLVFGSNPSSFPTYEYSITLIRE